ESTPAAPALTARKANPAVNPAKHLPIIPNPSLVATILRFFISLYAQAQFLVKLQSYQPPTNTRPGCGLEDATITKEFREWTWKLRLNHLLATQILIFFRKPR